MRQAFRLLRETFAYGLRSTIRCYMAVFLFFGCILIPFVVSTGLLDARQSSQVISWTIALVSIIMLLALFSAYGLTVIFIRRLAPLPGQDVSLDTGILTEFKPLVFSSLNSGLLSSVVFALVLAPLMALMHRVTPEGEVNILRLGFSLVYVISMLVVAPLFVGFHQVILEGTRRSLRGIAEGFMLSIRKFWYPYVVIVVIWLCGSLIGSATWWAAGYWLPVRYESAGWVLAAIFAIRVLTAVVTSAAYVFTAACFNKVYETLKALSPEVVPPATSDAPPLDEESLLKDQSADVQ